MIKNFASNAKPAAKILIENNFNNGAKLWKKEGDN